MALSLHDSHCTFMYRGSLFMRILSILLLSGLSLSLMAQDQMMVRVNHEGIVTVMKKALEYNQGGGNGSGFKIPRGIYDLKVKRADLASNPIIQVLQEISDVNFNRDFPFYMYNSAVDVDGSIDTETLKSAVSNYTSRGFDLKLSFSVNKLSLKGSEISICEKKSGSRCGKGLKATIRNAGISLRNGNRINVVGDFRVDLSNNQAKVKLIKVTSNLNGRNAPQINITMGEVVVPPVSILINGQEAFLDTSSLRSEILNYRTFLSRKLLEFSAEFIAEDLAELVNIALQNQCLPTQLRVLEIANEDRPAPNGGYQLERHVVAADNTRVVLPRVHFPSNLPSFRGEFQAPPTYMEMLQMDLATIIKSARFDINLKNIRTPLDKDIEIRANGSFVLNNRRWSVGSTVGNTTRRLPNLNMDTVINRKDHFAVAIGEPMLNASLDLLNNVGVFQKVLDAQDGTGGVYINSIKAHFKSGATPSQDRLFLVANARINLREISTDGVGSWIRRSIAVWLERNNNNSVLYFPIQFEITPRFVNQPNGSVKLFMRLNSPFSNATTLRNDYGYPNNVTSATSTVRNSVIDILKESLGGNANREFEFPLDSYLNLKGVSLKPKSIRMIQSGYFMVSADVKDINFNALKAAPAGGGCQ